MCEAVLGRAAEIPAFIRLLRALRWVMARSEGGDVCPKEVNRLFLVALYGLWATPLGFGVKDILRLPKCFKNRNTECGTFIGNGLRSIPLMCMFCKNVYCVVCR